MQIRFSADLQNAKNAVMEINGILYPLTVLTCQATINKGADGAANPRVQLIFEGSIGVKLESDDARGESLLEFLEDASE